MNMAATEHQSTLSGGTPDGKNDEQKGILQHLPNYANLGSYSYWVRGSQLQHTTPTYEARSQTASAQKIYHYCFASRRLIVSVSINRRLVTLDRVCHLFGRYTAAISGLQQG